MTEHVHRGTCERCGEPFEQRGVGNRMGRRRRRCYDCSPARPNQDYVYHRQWRVSRRARLAATARELERVRQAHAVCGCGRDYLQVPLEEGHVCPRPLALGGAAR